MTDTTISVQTSINNTIARAKDPDKDQWVDATMLIFYNKAYDYIHKLLIRLQSEIVITDSTITMTATQEFSLASNMADFWSIVENGVYFDGVSKPLTPVTYENKIRAAGDTTDTNPESYYITDTDIGLIDVPTATSIAAYPTLSCRYFKKNTPLTLNGDMPYKNVFNQAISSFADSIAILKTENPTEEYTALYNALEETTLAIAKERDKV